MQNSQTTVALKSDLPQKLKRNCRDDRKGRPYRKNGKFRFIVLL